MLHKFANIQFQQEVFSLHEKVFYSKVIKRSNFNMSKIALFPDLTAANSVVAFAFSLGAKRTLSTILLALRNEYKKLNKNKIDAIRKKIVPSRVMWEPPLGIQ